MLLRSSIVVIALAAAGCTNVGERAEADASVVAADLHARLAITVTARPALDDDGAIAPDALPLLQSDLTEDSAVRIALLNNRDVRAAYARLGIASSDLVQAGLMKNPILSGNAKFFDGGTEIELGVTQSFLDLFFIPLREKVAESELDAARASITRQIVALVFDVRRAFVDVRAAERALALQRQMLDAAVAARDVMEKLHAAGNVTDPKLTAEEAAVTRARLDLAEAEAAIAEAREPLSVLLGVSGDEIAWKIAGELEDEALAGSQLEHVEERALAASLDLAEKRAHAEALARRAGLISLDATLPQLDLGLVAKKEVGSSEWGPGPSLAVGLPIFDAGDARAGAANSALAEALAQRVSMAVAVRSAARLLRQRVVSLTSRVTLARDEHVPVRARLVRETLRDFNAMQIGVFDVLMAKQAELDALREQTELLRRAWIARIDLEELLAGRLNHERLAANSPAPMHDETRAARSGGH